MKKMHNLYPAMTSITCTASDRQLRSCVPINYNKTLLKCLHGKPQVWTLNKISIPLPMDSSSEDIDNTDAESTDEGNKKNIL